ncbi:type VI secretion system-associated FHA domain protein TagH [Halodesulfovibrio aestuarii]|uniref:type VI secretion system-associated FHA domain protein TagH n=1 Tax=Halodesulfovibrio aestuarii TaxID=126333 RepID=UPI0003FD0E52
MSEQKCITLVVTNTQVLESGLSATKTFYEDGGSIGASPSDYWNLRDREGNIRLSHCRISMIDGEFCITDTSDATFVNGATMPVGWGKHAKLKDNDTIVVGNYEIRVHFAGENEVLAGNSRALEQLFDKSDETLASDMSVPPSYAVPSANEDGVIDDPLAALEELENSLSNKEEASVLSDVKDESESDYLVAKDQEWLGGTHTVQADSDFELNSAISLKRGHSVTNGVDETTLESIEQAVKGNSDIRDAGSGHFVTAPMLRGLGVNVGKRENLAEMQILSEEIGASLQAAVKGLLGLHHQVEDSRYGVMNKNLQPIEDNPLRLGLSYDETMKTMYDGQRSLVHLSAPAAIDESLQTVKHHNEAVQTATAEALAQVLRAFSPDVLLRRFKSYRRTGLHEDQSQDAWAWTMYSSYYAELISERQKGFEKLFWEIFDQAYDKKLREMQREL